MIEIIFLSIILSFLSCENRAFANESVNFSFTPRIVGGEDVDITDVPYMVSLRYQGDYFCSACAISEDEVLSVAHCFFYHPQMRPPYKKDVTAHTGTSSSRDLGQYHRVLSVILHPEYTGKKEDDSRHDIVYVKLRDKIELDATQGIAELPTQDVARLGSTGIMSGWGLTSPTADTPSRVLQRLPMGIINYEECQPFMPNNIVYKEQLCAFHSKGRGCGKGDSGGPLVMNNVVVGLHSWIQPGMCGEGRAEGFTNVFAERAFIDSVRGQSGGSSKGKEKRETSQSECKGKGKRGQSDGPVKEKSSWWGK